MNGTTSITVAAVAATLVIILTSAAAEAGAPPDFRLKDLDGNWVTLSEQLGEDVVYVTFWATWCVPCRREMPYLQAMHEELGDEGLRIIGVNTDPPATTSKIKPYIKRYKISYTTVLDPNNNVLDKYNPTRELPYAVLIDREGNVHEVFPGYRKGDEALLKEKVLALLADTPDHGAETGEHE
ncbi:MAG: TlpA disulfide reductase family protein [Thermoanaerobaculales bacterium]|jgi:peroxiredoxin|nr:TlpA disulfide reductase family protein [Thermoanaerobaculales bacterium]